MIFFKIIMLALLWLTTSLADGKYCESPSLEKQSPAGLAVAGEAEQMSMGTADASGSAAVKIRRFSPVQTFPSLVLPRVVAGSRQ